MSGFWIDTAPTIAAIIFAIWIVCTVAFIVIVVLDLRSSAEAKRPTRHETARRGHASHSPASIFPPLAGRRDPRHVERIAVQQSRPGLHHVLNIEPMDPR